MPIIIDEKGNGRFKGENEAAVGCTPKDFSPVLTGGYKNGGVLNEKLRAYGSDMIPDEVVWILSNIKGQEGIYFHYPTERDKHYGIADPYTVLIKNTSIFKDFLKDDGNTALVKKQEGKEKIGLPYQLFEDHLLTVEQSGTKIIFNYHSRLILEKLLLCIKNTDYYVLGEYLLLVWDEKNGDYKAFRQYEEFEKSDNLYYCLEKNQITELYGRAKRLLISGNFSDDGYTVLKDNSEKLSERDSKKPMYDMLVRELELMRDPRRLSEILKIFAVNSYSLVRNVYKLLGETDVPLKMYLTEAGNIFKAYKLIPQFELKLQNTPMFLVSELAPFRDRFQNQILCLSGKHYSYSGQKLTPEQVAAIESSYSITMVEGGAGTGKTEVIKHRLRYMSQNGLDMKKTCVLTYSRASAEILKREFNDVNIESFRVVKHEIVDKMLDESIESGLDLAQGQKLEAFHKVYMDSIGTKKTLDDADPEDVDSLLMYINIEKIELKYEHILIDDAHTLNSLDAVLLLKLALKNNVSLFLAGDINYYANVMRRNTVRPETQLPIYTLARIFKTFILSNNFRSDQEILEVYNNVFLADYKPASVIQPAAPGKISKTDVDEKISVNTYSSKQFKEIRSVLAIEKYLKPNLGKGESIAVLVPDLETLKCLAEKIKNIFPQNTVFCAGTEEKHDHIYLSKLSEKLGDILYKRREIGGFNELKEIIKLEAVKLNYEIGNMTLNSVNPSVLGWLESIKDTYKMPILRRLKDTKSHDAEIKRLQLSMMEYKAENDFRFSKLMSITNESRSDIVIGLIKDFVGMEFDHVVFLMSRSNRLGHMTLAEMYFRDENIGLTRARKSEMVMVRPTQYGQSFIDRYVEYVNGLK